MFGFLFFSSYFKEQAQSQYSLRVFTPLYRFSLSYEYGCLILKSSSIILKKCINLIVKIIDQQKTSISTKEDLMNKRKYTYKNKIPSSLKKKHQFKPKTLATKLKSVNRPSEKRFFPPIQREFKRHWKLPTFFMLTLAMIILIIPTMVVVPFIKDDKEHVAGESVPSEETQEKENSIAVPVMRSNENKVEHVPLETYVERVVASEMPIEFELESLKAQSLAARTYIVNHMMKEENGELSSVTDTTSHQVYKDEQDLRKLWGSHYEENMKKIKSAVADTKGEILTYEDAPILPAFFSTSNGYTENSEDYWDSQLPYLRSVKSDWDKDSPKFLDQKVFTIDQVADALNINLPHKKLSIEMSRTNSNRVEKLTIGDHTFSGREVREKLNLQSSDFSIKQNDQHLIFTTKGYGHGIGMSQYGANGMAKEGKTYKEIVEYYYKDVEISSVNDTADSLVMKQ